ncbi:hypothetical protein B8281_16040 [Cellulosimicrobium sp. TH-20]|uniref:hypothetical protein n=1 Tax=Cellulosimicrobium sp. TH-20 TaxID=1980001 RepID=UPI000A17EEDF|nr:hypothetical protein [Cellulosimicrobium sp. TH-20]ARK06003.1 hypothetical protein B8281_16040 [Cellulosimicrobium sp. TH-20]
MTEVESRIFGFRSYAMTEFPVSELCGVQIGVEMRLPESYGPDSWSQIRAVFMSAGDDAIEVATDAGLIALPLTGTVVLGRPA